MEAEVVSPVQMSWTKGVGCIMPRDHEEEMKPDLVLFGSYHGYCAYVAELNH